MYAERVVTRAWINKGRVTKAYVRIGIIAPLRADVCPSGALTCLRDAAGVELVTESQLIVSEIKCRHDTLSKQNVPYRPVH